MLVLQDGSLAITSPISLDSDPGPLDYVKQNLGGRVRFLIAPDLAHWLSIARWSKEFPEAKIIGVEGHDQKTGSSVKWDTLFTKDTNSHEVLRKYGLSEDLDFCYFGGFVGKE